MQLFCDLYASHAAVKKTGTVNVILYDIRIVENIEGRKYYALIDIWIAFAKTFMKCKRNISSPL